MYQPVSTVGLTEITFVVVLVSFSARFFTSDRKGGKCVCPRSFVCLFVCLLARLLKHAYMDLDEMLHAD